MSSEILGANVPLVIAHRGFSAQAPENTLAAFRLAAETTGWAECDVDVLADETAIICHDSTLDRTTSGSGAYEHLTWEDVSGLDAGSWFGPQFADERIPRLADLVDLMNETGLAMNVELKSPAGGARAAQRLVDATAQQLRRIRPDVPVIISSFNHLLLRLMGEAGPWPTACLFDRGQLGEDWRTLAELAGARYIHPCEDGLTSAQVAQMREAGFGVNPWTVNDPERAKELVAWGVTGVIGDNPAENAAALSVV